MTGQFRCAYSTPHYEATLDFYANGLDFPVLHSWDHGPDDRGTLFSAFSGIIEVLALPENPEEDSVWDHRAPQGVSIGIEVEDVDAMFDKATDRKLPIRETLGNRPWGHRNFTLIDPNGVAIYFFSEI